MAYKVVGTTAVPIKMEPSSSAEAATSSTNSGLNSASSSSTSGVQAVLASPLNGQFYVIGSPSDVLGTRAIAPRGGTFALASQASNNSNNSDVITGGGGNGNNREDRRRATHNEVERRRRDNINSWIMKLGKLIPDLLTQPLPEKGPPPKNVGGGALSKGGILAKACDFVTDLRAENQRLSEKVEAAEVLALANEQLQAQMDELKQENALLRQQLESHGITPTIESIL